MIRNTMFMLCVYEENGQLNENIICSPVWHVYMLGMSVKSMCSLLAKVKKIKS